MFSQYSWWDFIKVALLVLAVYYAYVLWVYYRQDIREWIRNRGEKPDAKPVSAESEEEEDNSSLYGVRHYAPESVPPQTTDLNEHEVDSVNQNLADSERNGTHEPDLNGIALNQEQAIGEETDFSIPILAEIEQPTEESLEKLMDAAQRVQVDDQGQLTPNDPLDQSATTLAEVINQQRNSAALADIKFNR